jgi:hypothetical protein
MDRPVVGNVKGAPVTVRIRPSAGIFALVQRSVVSRASAGTTGGIGARGASALRWIARTGSIILAGALVVALAPVARGAGPAPGADPSTMIVGGGDATEVYPFTASLQSFGQHFCGGSLIASKWVLTAKHCVPDPTDTRFNMRIGSINRNSGGSFVIGVEEIVHHFDRDVDLALIRTQLDVPELPVRIAPATAVGQPTRLLGWGQTCPTDGCGGPPVGLRQLDTAIVPDGDCSAGGIRASLEICIGNPNRAGACFGDSGGPSVTPTARGWRLTGVTSRGPVPCGSQPSIYVDVPANRGWIESVVGPMI